MIFSAFGYHHDDDDGDRDGRYVGTFDDIREWIEQHSFDAVLVERLLPC